MIPATKDLHIQTPTSVKRELVHKVDNNYPSLPEIFENYREIIKTLVRISKPRESNAKSDNGFRHKGNSHGLSKQTPKQQTPSKANPTNNSSPSTLENFNTSMSNVESKPSPVLTLKNLVSTVSCAQVLTVCHSVIIISPSVIVK